ncbi:MAG: RrF2 family transcriptional regulator [Bacillota bacterium]
MFQISAKTDYGLLIMLELARQEGKVVPLSPLAKRLKVSSPYLSRIANSLQKAGLVESREGAGGGYLLSRPAAKIPMISILEALSGELKVRCSHSGGVCPHFGECGLKSAWPLLIGDLKKSLAKKSLGTLLQTRY